MRILDRIDDLKKVKTEKPGGILTIYLDTDQSKPEQQRGQWKIQLKNSLEEIEARLISKGNDRELQNFMRLAEKAEKEIYCLEEQLQKGLILFASHDLTLWELHIVQVPLEFELFWKEWPQLSQLVVLGAHYPAFGIIHIQKEKVRVKDMELGEVIEEFSYTASTDEEDWRRCPGTCLSKDQFVSSVSHLDDYMKKAETPVLQMFRCLSGDLHKEARKRCWQGVFLLGEAEWTEPFIQAFPNLSFVRVTSKNVNVASPFDYWSGPDKQEVS